MRQSLAGKASVLFSPHLAQESRRIGFARRKHGEDGRRARLWANRHLLVRGELVGKGVLGRRSWGQKMLRAEARVATTTTRDVSGLLRGRSAAVGLRYAAITDFAPRLGRARIQCTEFMPDQRGVRSPGGQDPAIPRPASSPSTTTPKKMKRRRERGRRKTTEGGMSAASLERRPL